MEGGDIPVSELSDSTEVWERDMSVLGDSLSTSGSDTFLSTTSAVNLSSSSSHGNQSEHVIWVT